MKIILALFLILLSEFSYSQTFECSFQGSWADTRWTFKFDKNGQYTRISSGHYGSSTVNGEYIVREDTLNLLSGFNDTDGTVNEKYLLEGDSILIDLYLRYDYKILLGKENQFYQSRIRKVKYPQVANDDKALKNELEQVLNMAFNSKEINSYYHFEEIPERELLVESYNYLDATIRVGGRTAVFKPKSKINSKFYIEFDDINQNRENIQFQVRIRDEGVTIWFNFYKKNGKWIYDNPYIWEN